MSDFSIVMPELILSLYAMAALLVAVYTVKDGLTDVLTWATAGLMVALALWIGMGQSGTQVAFGGMLTDDAFARFAKVTILLSAAYALWLFRRVAFGPLVKAALATIQDMSRRERVIFAPLVVMTLLLGVYPAVVTDITGASVGALITEFRASVPAVVPVAATE